MHFLYLKIHCSFKMVKAVHIAMTSKKKQKKIKRLYHHWPEQKVNQLLLTPNKNDITAHKKTVHQVDSLQFCSCSLVALLYIKKFSVFENITTRNLLTQSTNELQDTIRSIMLSNESHPVCSITVSGKWSWRLPHNLWHPKQAAVNFKFCATCFLFMWQIMHLQKP